MEQLCHRMVGFLGSVPIPFPLIFSSAFFGVVTGFFQASAQMPPRGIYSDVTLPYLTCGLGMWVFACGWMWVGVGL